jgi:pimeloyl-ACP methyl ester carboxylesterase
LDAPGFGTERGRRSPLTITGITDDIRERFAAIRGDHSWSLLGISLGGMVALDWCRRYPADMQRCVVINASAANLSLPLDRFRPAGLAAVRGQRLTPAARERAVLAVSVNRTDIDLDGLAQQWATWHTERPPHRLGPVGQVAAALSFRLSGEIRPPLLVLASRGDRLVSSRCSDRIAGRLNATLRLHDDGGHDLALDDPGWICRQIADWRPGSVAA